MSIDQENESNEFEKILEQKFNLLGEEIRERVRIADDLRFHVDNRINERHESLRNHIQSELREGVENHRNYIASLYQSFRPVRVGFTVFCQ